MNVMAFALDKERLSIIEHHRRFYPTLFSTPTYELLMHLVVQADYLYEEAMKQATYRSYPCAAWEREYADECRLAYEHVALMKDQVSESWVKLQAFDWNVAYGMGVHEATERMAK